MVPGGQVNLHARYFTGFLLQPSRAKRSEISAPIHLTPMRDTHREDGQLPIVDRIHDPVVTDANAPPPPLTTAQRYCPRGTRVDRQQLNHSDQTPSRGGRDLDQAPFGRGLKANAIAHASPRSRFTSSHGIVGSPCSMAAMAVSASARSSASSTSSSIRSYCAALNTTV